MGFIRDEEAGFEVKKTKVRLLKRSASRMRLEERRDWK